LENGSAFVGIGLGKLANSQGPVRHCVEAEKWHWNGCWSLGWCSLNTLHSVSIDW
jgi:hypothetical protein